MKRNDCGVKRWLAMLLSIMLICMCMAGGIAVGETTTPTDLEIVEENEDTTQNEADAAPAADENGEEDELIGGNEADGSGDAGVQPDESEPDTGDGEPVTEVPDAAVGDPAMPDEVPDDQVNPDDNSGDAELPDADTGDPDQPDEGTGDLEQPETVPGDPSADDGKDPADTDSPSEDVGVLPPADLKTLYNVDIKVPSGWRNTASASVRIKITPASDQMWHKVRYRIGDENWVTVKNNDFVLYDGYYYFDIEVGCNAKMTVRLFGDEENFFDTNTQISIFDHSAPEVTAGFKDMLLHVEAVDDLSQVAGIQVNGLLFTTLTDGMLDVRMEDPLLGYRQLAVRAYDYAGNFSDPVTLDNPYYVEPTEEPTVKPTTKPTTKPKPTKKPSSNSSSGSSKPVTTPAPTATTVPTQQVVYVTTNPVYPNTGTVATPEPETVYVPLGPGQPYKSEGNMQTLDMLYSASTNKQFITVQTRAGETYYMVIDYDKPIDEENEIYETYFLNLVDDRDLMSVVSEDELAPTPTPQIVYLTPEPTEVPNVQVPPVPVEDDEPAGVPASLLLLIVGIAAIGGVAFWFVNSKKNAAASNANNFEDEYEFEDDDEESDM